MSEQRGVSRRASLKGLGVMSTAILLSGTAADAYQAPSKPVQPEKEKPAVNVVDVAVSRMAKGHS